MRKGIFAIVATASLFAASAHAGVVLQKRDGSNFTKHEGELVQAEYARYRARCEKAAWKYNPDSDSELSRCIERVYDHDGTNVPNTDVFHD